MNRPQIYESDSPLIAQRRANHRVAIIGVAAIALTMLWALWPQDDPTITVPPPPERPAQIASTRQLRPLDLAAFSAPVWDAPAVPPKPPALAEKPPAPLPAPLKLQLIGIVRDDTALLDSKPVYIAAVYDETADRLLMLQAGDSVGDSSRGSARITLVHAESVELTDPSGARRLVLQQPLAPIPGLSSPLDPGVPPALAPKGRVPKSRKSKP